MPGNQMSNCTFSHHGQAGENPSTAFNDEKIGQWSSMMYGQQWEKIVMAMPLRITIKKAIFIVVSTSYFDYLYFCAKIQRKNSNVPIPKIHVYS